MLVLLVILILALVVETTIIAVILFNWSLGNQNFPPFSNNTPVIANCPALTSHPVSQNSQNRPVLFDCSSSTQKMAGFRFLSPFTPNCLHVPGNADCAEPLFT